MTRHGFLWDAHFWTDFSHPLGHGNAGYRKLIRAWTKWGAMRVAERMRHQHWVFEVERRKP